MAGIPGSGKTTFVHSVVHGLNAKHFEEHKKKWPNAAEGDSSCPDVAYHIPMDGFHLTRKQLDELPNPKEAHYRRGAAFTFDPHKYSELVRRLRKPISAETTSVYAPSFDHAIKDPVEMDIAIPPEARIVIFEGNYVALDQGEWRDTAKEMDELWFVEVSTETAIERVVKRHIATGLSPNVEHARKRVLESDMRNGRDILAHRLPVQETIQSVEDQSWKTEQIKEVEATHMEAAPRMKVERMGSLAELAEGGGGC